MEKTKLQQRMRFQPTGMEVREEEGKESRTITGCAIVFNQETTLWDGKYEKIREVIAPSCVTPAFLKEQDIKLNLLHDRESTVARNNKGVGTLKLELRADGLYFEAEMPKCDLGDQALELVRNKTYTGCSFEFWPMDYSEVTTELPDGREDVLITHTAFKRIDALTIAMDPAYEQTSVSEREIFQKREESIADEHKRNEEKAAEAKREAEKKTREAKLSAIQRDIELMELENL